MNKYVFVILLLILKNQAYSQEDSTSSDFITFHINDNVKNSEEKYFQELLINWKTYLISQNYMLREVGLWNEDIQLPDYIYVSLLMELRETARFDKSIQCSILGIIPVKTTSI